MNKTHYQKEIKKIVKILKEKYKPEKIILFGSFASGRPKENSEVDLAVIKKQGKGLDLDFLKWQN